MTSKARVLVVDDEEYMLEVCGDILRKLPGIEVFLDSDGEKAAERLKSERFDLLVADLRMPKVGGMDLLRLGRGRDPDLSMILLTAFPSVETAVESMKLGAADYLTKPFLPDDLLLRARWLLDAKRLREEHLLLERHVERSYSFDEIIGRSPVMMAVFETIRRVAVTDADVLILGETGSGKELVARSIHQRSRRREGRFVPVDCSAIPEDLLESEFFGHERGAFTGAHSRSLGLLEFANQGTFFLDEIGELPLRLQSKLLRVLQERCIRRVGGREEIPVDVRVVAATSRDLAEEMRERRFRQELFYRINVARTELPSLRERREDIPLLVEHFVQHFAGEMGREVTGVDGEAMEVLTRYPWPGNVREVQNVVKRALAMSRSPLLSLEDLPDEVVMAAGEQPVGAAGGFFGLRAQRLAAFEREYLTNLMRNCQGDVSRGAREARIPRGTLYRLMKRHDIDPDAFRHQEARVNPSGGDRPQ